MALYTSGGSIADLGFYSSCKMHMTGAHGKDALKLSCTIMWIIVSCCVMTCMHLYCYCFSDQLADVVLKCQKEAERPGITFVQDEQQQYIV